MSAAITSGQTRTEVSRIYDRLRKRSQRYMWMGSRLKYTKSSYSAGGTWSPTDHEAYVAGVRDALNAMEGV